MARPRFSFKGWYKGWYFRSLKELSYAYELDKQNTPWIGAEISKFTVEYIDTYGKKRKHYPDFFVDNKIVVEIKPRAHQKGKNVILKANAMREHCEKNGWYYNMISPRKIKKADLVELIEKKLIQFTDDCQSKISAYLKKRR